MVWNSEQFALSIFPLGDILLTLFLLPFLVFFVIKATSSGSVRKRVVYLTLAGLITFAIAVSLEQILLYT